MRKQRIKDWWVLNPLQPTLSVLFQVSMNFTIQIEDLFYQKTIQYQQEEQTYFDRVVGGKADAIGKEVIDNGNNRRQKYNGNTDTGNEQRDHFCAPHLF